MGRVALDGKTPKDHPRPPASVGESQIMGERTREPVRQKRREGAPEGRGVVEVRKVGELVGKGLCQDGVGPTEQGGIEANLTLTGTLSQNTWAQWFHDDTRRRTRQGGKKVPQEAFGTFPQPTAAIVPHPLGDPFGLGMAAAGADHGAAFLPYVVTSCKR